MVDTESVIDPCILASVTGLMSEKVMSYKKELKV